MKFKQAILDQIINPKTRNLVNLYFLESEIQTCDAHMTISETWTSFEIKQLKQPLYLNDNANVVADYWGHELDGKPHGLGFCLYRFGLENGMVASHFENGKLNGTCVWIRSVMVAGNCSLHILKHSISLCNDSTVWLMKV